MYQAEFANNLHKAQSSLYRQLSPAERRLEHSPDGTNTVSSKASLHMNPNAKFQIYEAEKSRKEQNQQYICAKNDLKNEYRKKMGFLFKRLSKKGTQLDPSQILMNSMTSQEPISAKNGSGSSFNTNIEQRQNRKEGFSSQSVGAKYRRQSTNTTTVGGVMRNHRGLGSREADFDFGALNDSNVTRKENETGALKKSEYFNFYLENAQKAINMMIVQHKSQQNLAGATSAGMSSTNYASNTGIPSDQQHLNRFNQNHYSHTKDHIIDMRQDQQAVNGQDVSATIYENDLSHDQLINNNDTKLSGYQSTTNYSSHLDPIVNGHKRISRIAVKQQTRKPVEQQISGQGEFRSTAGRSIANRRNIPISNSVATGGGRMKPFSAQTRHGGPNQRGNFPTTP